MRAAVSVKQLQSFWCKLFLTPNKKTKQNNSWLKKFSFFPWLAWQGSCFTADRTRSCENSWKERGSNALWFLLMMLAHCPSYISVLYNRYCGEPAVVLFFHSTLCSVITAAEIRCAQGLSWATINRLLNVTGIVIQAQCWWVMVIHLDDLLKVSH